jgi:hypothetical protein
VVKNEDEVIDKRSTIVRPAFDDYRSLISDDATQMRFQKRKVSLPHFSRARTLYGQMNMYCMMARKSSAC